MVGGIQIDGEERRDSANKPHEGTEAKKKKTTTKVPIIPMFSVVELID